MKKLFLIVLLAGTAFLIPNFVLAATLFFNPSSGSFSVGSTFTVSVRTNTQGAAVNTAEATITYSTETLELVSVGAGSTFPLQTPGSPSKSTGRAYFSGGLPTPGYNGGSGILGIMTFRAKAVGRGAVSVQSGKVLLNDGQGTNALSGNSDAFYTITPPPVGGPEVTSSTHPDQSSWYAATTTLLSWSRPSGAHGFSFEFDQLAETIPDDILDTTITTTKTYPDLKDGVWYFHIKAKPQTGSFGVTTHFKIQVDTEAPKSFEIKLVGQNDLNEVTTTPTIEFLAQDLLSGVDHYNIFINGNIFKENATSSYTFEKLETGQNLIEVIAYDKAGNFKKSSLSITVASPKVVTQKVFNVQYWIFIFLVLILIVLLLILFLLLLFYRRKKEKEEGDPVVALQRQIDESIIDLKKHIDLRLVKFAKKYTGGLGKEEEAVVEQINQNILEAKDKVDQQVTQLGKLRKPQSK